MASNASKIAGWGSNQWPSFDEDWHYVGPLARCDCVISKALVKKNNHESFATTGTSQYPPAMDQALAEALLDDLMADSLAILSLEEGFGNMAKEQKQHEEVASAAYYWQRTAACMVRLCHRLAGQELGVTCCSPTMGGLPVWVRTSGRRLSSGCFAWSC